MMYKPDTSTGPPPMPSIPTINTSPASQLTAAVASPIEPSLGSVAEIVDEPETIPEDKPADPRVVLGRTMDQPRISTETKPSFEGRKLPQLSAALLPYTRIVVPHTAVHANAAGRDILCFIVNITVRPPNSNPVSWGVSKLFSSFVDLDTKLKAKSGKRSKDWAKTVTPLPDGRAWKDSAPSKIDQRRTALEAYLQSILMAPLADKSDLCMFLSTDPVQAKAASVRKEGYLTKKVKGMGGGWKTRYFMLDGHNLDCMEAVSRRLKRANISAAGQSTARFSSRVPRLVDKTRWSMRPRIGNHDMPF
jgi:RalA-binding protein 1